MLMTRLTTTKLKALWPPREKMSTRLQCLPVYLYF